MLKTFTKYKSDRKIVKINHKIGSDFNIYRLFGQNTTKTDPAYEHFRVFYAQNAPKTYSDNTAIHFVL